MDMPNLTWRVIKREIRCFSGNFQESAHNAGDLGLIPGSGRSPGKGNGYSLQYSCLETPMDRGAWQATMHGVARVRHNLETKPPPPGNSDKSDPRLVEVYEWNSAVPLPPVWTVQHCGLESGHQNGTALRQELGWVQWEHRWPYWLRGSSHQQLEWRPTACTTEGDSQGLQPACRLSVAGPPGSQGLHRPLRSTVGVLLGVLNLISAGTRVC